MQIKGLNLAHSRSFVEKELGLPVNVDYYSAGVYGALGIPTDFATSIFAVARTSGWVAHITEQLANNRLIRPRSDYIGYAPFLILILPIIQARRFAFPALHSNATSSVCRSYDLGQ